MAGNRHEREALALRVLWMLVLVVAWGVAETLLALLIIAQLLLRLINGEPSQPLARFGDGLSRYLAAIGRFACFRTEEKPWPFAEWPVSTEHDPERPA